MAQALQQDKIIKKSADLYGFGIPSKATISATYLIDRLKAASSVAGWDTDGKRSENFIAL